MLYLQCQADSVVKLRIRSLTGFGLELCEVTVFGEREEPKDEMKEVALNQYSTQSSTYRDLRAHLAVDGKSDFTFSHNFCTSTKRENNPWWEVDLGNIHNLDRVAVYNSDSDTISNLAITMRDSKSDGWSTCTRLSGIKPRAVQVASCHKKTYA